jgi:hypothetical protein
LDGELLCRGFDFAFLADERFFDGTIFETSPEASHFGHSYVSCPMPIHTIEPCLQDLQMTRFWGMTRIYRQVQIALILIMKA